MTQGAVYVLPEAPIVQAAEQMVRNHVHRVIVTDDKECLVGIVSAMDVLRALTEEND
jgi:CBS domain-containing protein